ncbi:MAG TPA: hypothetical protein ENI39_07590, partial [Anaerolineae bacterium]|nr:hypothetical protein [Anaerolineae bacterium]
LWPWRLLTLAVPDLFGNPAHGNYWGYGNYWEDAVYIGLLPLLLAAKAGAGLRRKNPWRAATAFWSLVIGCSLLLALGRNTPVFSWLFDHVPTFDWFQAPARWLALTTVAAAALTGLGAQAWQQMRSDRRWGALGVVLGLAATLGGLAAPRVVPAIPSTFGPATARYGLMLAATGGLVLARPRGSSHKGRLHWQAAVAGLVFLDLAAFGWGLVPSVDRALYAGRSHTSTALAADLAAERIFWPARDHPEPGYDLKFSHYFRFDTFGGRDLNFWWSLRETLLPNLGMLDGMASANNFDPLLVSWYTDVARAADDAPGLLRAMGVTHLVTATAEADVHVTAIPDPLGRAWVVPTARVLPPDKILPTLTAPSFDPTVEVLLEHPTSSIQHPVSSIQHPVSSIRYRITLHDTPNHVTIHAVLDQPGYLVVADTWYPGWQASVDGEPVPLLRANHAFRAVYLHTGEHTVEMVYRPLSVIAGAAVSLASLAGLAVGLVWARRLGKRT